jgi:hypothetical protein
MNQPGEKQPTDDAEKVLQAIDRKLKQHRQDLNEAHHGLVKFRKQNGKIDIELTTTK